MTRINRSTYALLAGAALITTAIGAPAPALAQAAVADQTEEVVEKAEDLQAATNSLNDELAQQEAAAAATNAAVDGDGDVNDRDRDDDGGKWGWLGLLGLAGLLGLRRRDDHVNHDHRTDHRTDNRDEHRADTGRKTTTGTGTGTGTDTTRL